MIECKKCQLGEILYTKTKSKGVEVTTPIGLVRCSRHGRRYISNAKKSECDCYKPIRRGK